MFEVYSDGQYVAAWTYHSAIKVAYQLRKAGHIVGVVEIKD